MGILALLQLRPGAPSASDGIRRSSGSKTVSARVHHCLEGPRRSSTHCQSACGLLPALARDAGGRRIAPRRSHPWIYRVAASRASRARGIWDKHRRRGKVCLRYAWDEHRSECACWSVIAMTDARAGSMRASEEQHDHDRYVTQRGVGSLRSKQTRPLLRTPNAVARSPVPGLYCLSLRP